MREVQGQDWGEIGILPGLLSVDWGYEIDKGAKEGRDWGQSLRCVHHQCTFYGSSWRSVTTPWANELQDFPIDWAEVEPTVTAHFLHSFFSFINMSVVLLDILVCSPQPARNSILYHRDSQCTFVSVTIPIVGMTASPGFCSLYNICVLITDGMSSLLEREDSFFMGIHILFSALAAVFIVNQKISNGLCIEEGLPTLQIDILRDWNEIHCFPPWFSNVPSQVSHFTSLDLSFWKELIFVSIVPFSSNFNCRFFDMIRIYYIYQEVCISFNIYLSIYLCMSCILYPIILLVMFSEELWLILCPN